MNELNSLLVIGAIAAGTVRGFSGFGGPMVLVPLLSIFYPPAIALWIMTLVDLPQNVFLIQTSWRHATARVFVPLTVGSLLTLAIGTSVLVVVDALLMRRVICVAIILPAWSCWADGCTEAGSALAAGLRLAR